MSSAAAVVAVAAWSASCPSWRTSARDCPTLSAGVWKFLLPTDLECTEHVGRLECIHVPSRPEVSA